MKRKREWKKQKSKKNTNRNAENREPKKKIMTIFDWINSSSQKKCGEKKTQRNKKAPAKQNDHRRTKTFRLESAVDGECCDRAPQMAMGGVYCIYKMLTAIFPPDIKSRIIFGEEKRWIGLNSSNCLQNIVVHILAKTADKCEECYTHTQTIVTMCGACIQRRTHSVKIGIRAERWKFLNRLAL